MRSYEVAYKFLPDGRLQYDEYFRFQLRSDAELQLFHRARAILTKVSDEIPKIYEGDEYSVI